MLFIMNTEIATEKLGPKDAYEVIRMDFYVEAYTIYIYNGIHK
jgi:hypothetical protein